MAFWLVLFSPCWTVCVIEEKLGPGDICCSRNYPGGAFEWHWKVFTDFVTKTVSQLCKTQSQNCTAVELRSKWRLQTGVVWPTSAVYSSSNEDHWEPMGQNTLTDVVGGIQDDFVSKERLYGLIYLVFTVLQAAFSTSVTIHIITIVLEVSVIVFFIWGVTILKPRWKPQRKHPQFYIT